MQNVFRFRNDVVQQYQAFSRSFCRIKADDILETVNAEYAAERYWPEPLIQINPNYKRAANVDDLAREGLLHPDCARIFRYGPQGNQSPIQLFKHQIEALTIARQNRSYVVTTGTGSGKSLAFFIPIIDRILKAKETDPTPRTRAIIIYPMNALANSQAEEIGKFLANAPGSGLPLRVERYTGQENAEQRHSLSSNPPDILLTNFMMLELILTRWEERDRRVVENCRGLDFLVLDELHTYRGRQGADVAMLVRRLRQRLHAPDMLCIGTSATMSSTGTPEDQKRTVSTVASQIFGVRITEAEVIDETLERVTDPKRDIESVKPLLAPRLAKPHEWNTLADFIEDPLAIWVELTLGLDLTGQAGPRRARPIQLTVAAGQLADAAGVDQAVARLALEEFLTAALRLNTPDGRSVFAFKLHQWISGPGKVYCTLEEDGVRQITLDAQRFAPGRQEDGVLLFGTHFCRECGQEYHPVWEKEKPHDGFTPRQIDDTGAEDGERRLGFLTPVRNGMEFTGRVEELPDSWLDTFRVPVRPKPTFKKSVPELRPVDAQGQGGSGREFWFLPGKFRFCLNCGHEHTAHGRDINRLSSLSGEGRSSATTVLSLAILQQHFAEPLPEGAEHDPRKLLGFTDNRQDAALQAGHFNDFLFLLILRAGLLGALLQNGGSLTVETLADSVFRALQFDSTEATVRREYLSQPDLFGPARQEAERAVRFVLGYRLLRDLRKGWRFNNPNLLQLDLIGLEYAGLAEFASEPGFFAPGREPPNSTALALSGWDLLRRLAPEARVAAGRVIFDSMLRDLCLSSDYLDAATQDRMKPAVSGHLTERWAFGPDEILTTSRFLILDPRPDNKGRKRDDLIGGGSRSRLIRELRYSPLLENLPDGTLLRQSAGDVLVELVRAFLHASLPGGYVVKCPVDRNLSGWALKDTAVCWRINPQPVEDGSRANSFFRDLYRQVAGLITSPGHAFYDFEAQEHTAQVDPEKRKVLEARFRLSERDQLWWNTEAGQSGPLIRLPVLYCSPTMELGVDISALNTVYMRNVPPTPANYAQRSGRAGRSGQAALVLTYSAAMSPHDQWFFHHADQMVHGVVKAPTLDLANRDLIESHLHAVWLAAVQHPIETSIAPLLDLTIPEKPVQPELAMALSDPSVSARATTAAREVIRQVEEELRTAEWFREGFVEGVIADSAHAFSKALGRWRSLYDATQKQMETADAIAKSPATGPAERENAKRRYMDAVNQLKMLLKTSGGQNNDFYTFRYLASQGFLPGYNFPRLPLMAWIPAGGKARPGQEDAGNMVSRPRFLALSEFGPRSLIYHQGRMFRVVRAKLNVTAADHISAESTLATVNALVCTSCGYGHLGHAEKPEPDSSVCEYCRQPFTDESRVNDLYRIETVETRPVERISVNEEERQRQGFEIVTTYRFLPGRGGSLEKWEAVARAGPDRVATLTYSPAAALWRINRGWRRRKDKNQLGFYINPLTGQWSKQNPDGDGDGDSAPDDEPVAVPGGKTPTQRIVPFVEDTRNILLLNPHTPIPAPAMATLQAGLKRGIEQTFQIESAELVVEGLPTPSDRRMLLFYEAAEGGAGVLTQLAQDEFQFSRVARAALRFMHYEFPEAEFTMDDLTDTSGSGAAPSCEAGCYQCLLSYYNQPDHELIDRRNREALEILTSLANCRITRSSPCDPAAGEPDTPLHHWLAWLEENRLRLPDQTSVPVNGGEATADAHYVAARALVFLAPPQDTLPAYATDRGFLVIVFPDEESQWSAIVAAHPHVFDS